MISSRAVVLCVATAGMISGGTAQAALFDRGGGLVYDDVLNITWLQDANYAKTSKVHFNGQMTWVQANAWAESLVYHDSVRNVDYSDWRLPGVSPINGSAFNLSVFDEVGTTDKGLNISAPGTKYAGSTGSEMAYLFFNDLRNKAIYNTLGVRQYTGFGLTNTGSFQNLQNAMYWGGEYTADASKAWYFYMNYGAQDIGGKSLTAYAMAVRSGDVAAVPEPEVFAMLLAGLGMIGGIARRRKVVPA